MNEGVEHLRDTHQQRILCVGRDLLHQSIRCMVLRSQGFDATPATILKVEELFSAGPYSLVILCATLTEEDKRLVRGSAWGTPMFLEPGLVVGPQDLLKAVGDLLGRDVLATERTINANGIASGRRRCGA